MLSFAYHTACPVLSHMATHSMLRGYCKIHLNIVHVNFHHHSQLDLYELLFNIVLTHNILKVHRFLWFGLPIMDLCLQPHKKI